MSGILFRHWTRQYLRFCGGLMGAVLAIYLMADFVDRAKTYTGPNWVRDAAILYGYKALVVFHQVAPGVLLLASAVMVAVLARRGELTAMRALTFGPWAVLGPIALVATVSAVFLVGFDELVVGKASFKVDEITAMRFHTPGEWLFYYGRHQWFRHGDQIFNLQQGDASGGFGQVSILTLSPDFRLQERMDAAHMVFLAGTRWRLTQVVERTFQGSTATSTRTYPALDRDFGVNRDQLNILPGKPEVLPFRVLRDQIRARRQVGLPVRSHLLALHNRFAYPLAGVPAALLAAALAMRRSRASHVTSAIVEGLLVILVLWGLMVISRSLVLSGRMAPGLAAWTPSLVLGVILLGITVLPGAAGRYRLRPLLKLGAT